MDGNITARTLFPVINIETVMGRESARSSHKRCLVHTCGYGSTMRSDDTMFIQIKSFISLRSFIFEFLFIHSDSYSIGSNTVGYGFLKYDSNRRRPQLYINLQKRQ